MRIYLAIKVLITTTILVFALNTEVNALATRTWVSGTGDDANPCSRIAPCKTFAGAISKTNAGGEIDALDPGGFGALTITQAVTIDGSGTFASILVSGTNAVIVNAGANDVVVLRGLSFNGIGAGLDGIRFNSGKMLVIEDCIINGFINNGININLAAAGSVVVSNTMITNCATGIKVNGTGNSVNVSLSNISIKGATNHALHALQGIITLDESIITQNAPIGVLAENNSEVNCISNIFSSNAMALQANPGATIRISTNSFYNNAIGIGNGGGSIATANNNDEAGSTTTNSPTDSIITQ